MTDTLSLAARLSPCIVPSPLSPLKVFHTIYLKSSYKYTWEYYTHVCTDVCERFFFPSLLNLANSVIVSSFVVIFLLQLDFYFSLNLSLLFGHCDVCLPFSHPHEHQQDHLSSFTSHRLFIMYNDDTYVHRAYHVTFSCTDCSQWSPPFFCNSWLLSSPSPILFFTYTIATLQFILLFVFCYLLVGCELEERRMCRAN